MPETVDITFFGAGGSGNLRMRGENSYIKVLSTDTVNIRWSEGLRITNSHAKDFRKLLGVLEVAENADRIEVIVKKSRANLSRELTDRISLAEIDSLGICYDRKTRDIMAKNQQFFELVDDLDLRSLSLENVPVTRALESLFNSNLFKLTIKGYSALEFQLLLRILQNCGVRLHTLVLDECRIPLGFFSSTLQHVEQLVCRNLNLDSLCNILPTCELGLSKLTLQHPSWGFLSRAKLIKALGFGCPKLDTLEVFDCGWFNHSMFHALASIWATQSKVPLKLVRVDFCTALKFESFSDVSLLSRAESALTQSVEFVPKPEVTRCVQRLDARKNVQDSKSVLLGFDQVRAEYM